MYYSILHKTRYRYSSPVSEGVTEVRMRPRSEGGQRCLSFRLTTSPASKVHSYTDSYGNIVHHFDVPTPHRTLTITAESMVILTPPDPLPESGVPPVPAFVRDGTAELQRFLSHRCGAMKLRLGDDLRQGGEGMERGAVLLVEAEPQRDQLVFGPSRLQTQGLARGSLVACVQLSLRGHVLQISRLQPGERITVQVVIGVAGE